MEDRPEAPCPACRQPVPIKGLAKHASGCQQWAALGVPLSQFNWDRYFKRGLYADGLTEGTDYVRCQECPDGARGDRGLRLMDHVKKVHGLTKETYLERHPGALLNVPATLERRKATVSERYDGATNVFQVPDVKDRIRDVMAEKYGGMGVGSPELRAKIEATNEARYQSANPFGSAEVQEKIRATWREKYQCDNPNQSPEIMAKRIATNRKTHGADHYVETDDFKGKFKEASQERFKADHPMQSEEGKQLCFDGVQANHGVDTVFSLPEVQKRAYESNLANHGGKHSQKCPEVLEKARATWREKYNTDNPSKVEAVKQKIKDVWEGKYGVPFPPQSLWLNQTHSSPNGLERKVQAMLPVYVLYTGDKTYNVRLPGTSRDKYPDFVVLAPDQLRAYQSGTPLKSLRIEAVCEAFGSYWHGPEMTGVSRDDHYNEVMDYYARCGLRCLILWEHDVDKRPGEVADRLRRFLSDVAGVVTPSGGDADPSVLDFFRGA